MWVVVLALAGCDQGYPQRCCADEEGRPVIQGVGRVSQCTCASNTVCEYGFFETCTDDTTRCVVTVARPLEVRCAGGMASTESPCCIDRGEDGVGTRSMCECPVFGACEGGLRGENVEAIDATQCRLTPAPWIDASAADAGG
jgi:hypothetical protein